MSGSHPETFSNKDIIFASIESRRSLVPSFKGSKRKKSWLPTTIQHSIDSSIPDRNYEWVSEHERRCRRCRRRFLVAKVSSQESLVWVWAGSRPPPPLRAAVVDKWHKFTNELNFKCFFWFAHKSSAGWLAGRHELAPMLRSD